jgi:hypothetical protein
VQQRLWRSKARFRLASAGRRSGKTELGKRYGVKSACQETEVWRARFIFAAPTYAQAKEIFWEDLKALTPSSLIDRTRESQLTIQLKNSARIMVAGLDRPERIEGSPVRGIVIDEIANCPSDTWEAHIRPALSDPNCIGWAWLIGVPEGRNFYYRMAKEAEADTTGQWAHFTWPSADILPPEEIAAAKATMDPMIFAQEYMGSFITFTGRAYYDFTAENVRKLKYDKKQDLIFCFDFNVEPGTASVWQEQPIGSCCIGEVWIPKNSNTPAVCKQLVRKWGPKGVDHKGRVKLFGDPTGGARGTAKVAGTDWEIIVRMMREAFPGKVQIGNMTFERVSVNVSKRSPLERVRVNAVNARISTADGERHLFVDPKEAPNMIIDFEGVRLKPDGSGEIEKGKKGDDKTLTHLTDGAGYYFEKAHPVRAGKTGGVIQL